MPGQLRSPRTFCLHCGKTICEKRLRAEKVNPYLFGFCSSTCEINFGVRLSGSARRVSLPPAQRLLLANIEKQLEGGAQVAELTGEDYEAASALARKRLVTLHGRRGAVPTVRGDISYVCSRFVLDAEELEVSEPDTDQLEASWYQDHGQGLPVWRD